MENATDTTRAHGGPNRDVAWRAVWSGFAIALAGTLIAGGGGLAFAGHGMWWVAYCGAASLFVGGVAAGWLAGTAEPLNGAFIAVFYFGTVALTIFVGEFLAVLPDPLPGVPRGDSTFFFVWPLAQLASSTVGAAVGGWLFAKRRKKLRDEDLS
ncbi:MAG: hypothetical protein HY526_11730 [Betaproteobacteria bacterium]|nr:hypothetical protein [Betaproteobacteria bacterium]